MEKSSNKTFHAPSIDDCIAYGKTIILSGDECMAFYDYQLSIGWKVGKNPMKDWQAAMRTWKRNAIKWARPAAVASKPQSEASRRIFLENRAKSLTGAIQALRDRHPYDHDKNDQYWADMKANKDKLAAVEKELNGLI